MKTINKFFNEAKFIWLLIFWFTVIFIISYLIFILLDCTIPTNANFNKFAIYVSLLLAFIFGFMGAFTTINIRENEKNWEKIDEYGKRLNNVEEYHLLFDFQKELNDLRKDSTGPHFNAKILEFQTIINLKAKYLKKCES